MSTTLQTQTIIRHSRPPVAVFVLWILIVIAIPISIALSPVAWDVTVYRNAIRSLHADHDPYLDAIATQKLYYSHPVHPVGDPPFSYVYSPVTLPLLRFIGVLPIWLSGSLYWLVYSLGVLAEIWVAMRAVEESERRLFLYLGPLAIFFPGLLANGVVLGGNIAYILYGLILLTAVLGWRRNIWLWFYVAVLVATCVKAPLLSLAMIPCLSARKQWIPTAITTIIGVALFAGTSFIWPNLFKHFLQAIELQLNLNRDFGCSPAGLFSGVLHDRGIPYSSASVVFYLAYAIPVFALLFSMSRRFLAGAFSLKQWMPVLLVGVILLNPRLIEYDLAAVTVPLALIAWRVLTTFNTPLQASLWLGLVFVVANCIALQSWGFWKLTEGPFIVVCFAAGCWNLLKQSAVPEAQSQIY